MHKKVFSSLYFQVSLAITLGVFLGHVYPDLGADMKPLGDQGESVNILLKFTQFFEASIEYLFQVFTAHSCHVLLPSDARFA